MRKRFVMTVLALAALLAVVRSGLWQPVAVPALVPVHASLPVRYVTDWEKGPHHRAHSVILYERTTGTVLAGTNIHGPRAPASTTKIMTALIALEIGHLDDVVTVSQRAAGTRGSSARLYSGQKITLLDLLHGLLLNSGNDAAVAIAEHLAPSEAEFAVLMNERAAQLGLTNTSFRNPHGLDEPGHMSTAYDLAVLTAAAMGHELFAEIVAKKQYSGDSGSWQNTNQLLWRMEGIEGVKTGTTGQAGYCLVAAISREGMQLISVVLGSSDRWNDSLRLLNYGFDQFQRLTVVQHGTVLGELVLPNLMGPVVALARDDISLVVPSDSPVTIDYRTVWSPPPKGVRVGDELGVLHISMNGEPIGALPLLAEQAVLRKTPLRVLWQWIGSVFE